MAVTKVWEKPDGDPLCGLWAIMDNNASALTGTRDAKFFDFLEGDKPGQMRSSLASYPAVLVWKREELRLLGGELPGSASRGRLKVFAEEVELALHSHNHKAPYENRAFPIDSFEHLLYLNYEFARRPKPLDASALSALGGRRARERECRNSVEWLAHLYGIALERRKLCFPGRPLSGMGDYERKIEVKVPNLLRD